MMIARARGFTLVELLVTLMIMVAMLGVAVPQFSRAMLHLQLRKSTQEIAAVLRQARNSSISQSRTAALVLDTEDHTLQSGPDGRVYQWPADIDVAVVSNATYVVARDTSIRFYPDGTASGGMLMVSANERSYTISVDWLTGRVRVL